MKKKFIQKSDLGEIMGVLAESAMRHAGKIEVSIRISYDRVSDESVMDVHVMDRWYKMLKRREYVIVEELENSYDIIDDTIGDGLHELEKREKAKKEAKAKAEAEDVEESKTTSSNN